MHFVASPARTEIRRAGVHSRLWPFGMLMSVYVLLKKQSRLCVKNKLSYRSVEVFHWKVLFVETEVEVVSRHWREISSNLKDKSPTQIT